MQLELTKEQFDTMPEGLKTLCSETDGKYSLTVETPDEVAGLKSALEKRTKAEKENKRLLDEALAKYKDVDPERYAQLLAEAEKKETDELKSKGSFEEFVEKQKAREKKMNDDWQAKYDALQADYDRSLIDGSLRTAFEKAGVIPDRIDDAVLLTKPLVKKTDKGELQILDKDGSPLDASLDTYAKELLKEAKPWLYAASGVGGSGAQNGTGGQNGKKQIKAKELETMNPATAASLMADVRAGKAELVD